MDTKIVAFIKGVRKGRTKNWLVFEAYIGRFDVSKQYTIEFCGTDIISYSPLTYEQKMCLKELFVQDFGYAPYSIKEVEGIIGDGKQYVINE